MKLYFYILALIFSFIGSAEASTCRQVFSPHKIQLKTTYQKSEFLGQVAENTGNKSLKKIRLKVGQDPELKARYNKLVEKIDLNSGASAVKLEVLSQKLIELIKVKNEGYFRILKKALSPKSEPHVKELVRQRLLVLTLSRDISLELKKYGLYQKSTWRTRAQRKLKKYILQRKLVQAILINGLSIHFLGWPVYIPNVDFISHTYFSPSVLKMVEKEGFGPTYKDIKNQFSLRVGAQKATHTITKVLTATFLATYLAYFSYGTYKAGKLTYGTYEILQDVEYSHTYFLLSSVPKENKIYDSWADLFYQMNAREPDINNNQFDRSDWKTYLIDINTSWASAIEQEYGRRPNMKESLEDRKAWIEFVKIPFDSGL